MTIIAAARTSRSVCIGSDSVGTDADGIQEDYGSKLLRFEWGAVGLAGQSGHASLIREALADSDGFDTKRHATATMRRVREALLDAGCKTGRSGGLPVVDDFEMLVVGRRGAIWSVNHDLTLLRLRAYTAVGSGAAIGIGAMHALRRSAPAPDLVEAAVRAAIKHSDSCGGRLHRVTFDLTR